jgi:sucrose phosphorylase
MQQRAFHPNADQRVLMISPDVFAVVRTSPEGDQHVLALTNVTDREIEIEIPLADTGVKQTDWRDLLSDRELKAEKGILSIPMQPYDILWLT